MNYESTQPQAIASDAVNFSNFMRFLAPPTPVTSYGTVTAASITNGAAKFVSVGCAHNAHTPSMETGSYSTGALAYKTANLYSDLLLHHMGTGLADGIFRGAPPRMNSVPHLCGDWANGCSSSMTVAPRILWMLFTLTAVPVRRQTPLSTHSISFLQFRAGKPF